MENGAKGGGWIPTVIGVLIVLCCIGSCSMCGSGSSSNSGSKTCKSCDRTYTNSADVSSIRRTNMCEPCYENYKFSKELKEELKKYEERYK